MGFDERYKESAVKPAQYRISRDEIYMPPGIEREVNEIIHTFSHPEDFGTELGFKGALLTGANGVGKTLISHYIASSVEADLLPISSLPRPEFVSMIFEGARSKGESDKKLQIMFLDEVQKYSNREDLADPKQQEVIDQLKIEMDGGKDNRYIRWLATSDKPDKIDTALRRNRRLGKELDIYPPTEEGRLEILRILAYRHHAKNMKGNGDGRVGHKLVFREADLEEISKDHTHGFTGDDLWGLLSRAGVRASYDKKKTVEMSYLIDAAKSQVPTALKDMPFRRPKKSLDDIAGLAYHKELALKEIGDRFDASSDGKAILLWGASGAGKTTFAEAIAEHYRLNLLKVEGSSLMNWLLGKTGHDFEKTINRAKTAAPSMLLLDEFGSFAKTKEIHGYKDTWTGRIRSMMDSIPKGVVIAATLTNPKLLEDETRRRFSLQMRFDVPDRDEAESIWDIYLPGTEGDRAELLTSIADRSKGLTGADIEQISLRLERYGISPTIPNIEKLIDMHVQLVKDKYLYDNVAELKMVRMLGLK